MPNLLEIYGINEDAIDDNGVEMQISPSGRNLFKAKLSYKGVKIGFVEVRKDEKNKLMRVEQTIVENDWQRKGIGMAMYVRMGDWAKKMGFKLASDLIRSAQAEALWKKLEVNGLADQTKLFDEIEGSEAVIYIMR